MNKNREAIDQINRCMNRIDGLYYMASRKLGVKDNTLLLFYVLNDGKVHSQKEICEVLLDRFALKMVILTCGDKGSYVLTAEESSWVDTPKVNVVSTVGAGDSFTGTFIASILLGKTIRQAHEAAVRVSAYVCTCQGAMPAIPQDLLF